MKRTSILQVVFNNAFFLSVVYLLLGLGADLIWRFHQVHWIYRFSFALDALPAQTLDMMGLLAPLQLGYAHGQISELALRWIFAFTTLGVIFVTALWIGLMMGLTRRIWDGPQPG